MSRDIIDKKEKKEKRSLYCSSTVVLASCGCSRCCLPPTLAAVAPAVAAAVAAAVAEAVAPAAAAEAADAALLASTCRS